MPLEDMTGFLEQAGFAILPILAAHAVTSVEPSPGTKDPFDRLLLAQCHVEGLRLMTFDRALMDHPFALKSD
jgi:PIN domain nuclease of toxin-antitoxin system